MDIAILEFDWLSGLGISAILPCQRNSSQKSSSRRFLQNEVVFQQDLAIF